MRESDLIHDTATAATQAALDGMKPVVPAHMRAQIADLLYAVIEGALLAYEAALVPPIVPEPSRN